MEKRQPVHAVIKLTSSANSLYAEKYTHTYTHTHTGFLTVPFITWKAIDTNPIAGKGNQRIERPALMHRYRLALKNSNFVRKQILFQRPTETRHSLAPGYPSRRRLIRRNPDRVNRDSEKRGSMKNGFEGVKAIETSDARCRRSNCDKIGTFSRLGRGKMNPPNTNTFRGRRNRSRTGVCGSGGI